ncbi:MAG: cysteine hydrolase [Acidobacteriota bacterium]|nr:cysteine hydrolase [Acidobacteriota bacterium]
MSDHEKVKEIIRLKDHAPINIDPLKSALLVVDVQRYFARPDYPFAQTFEKLVPGSTAGYFERVKSRVLPNIQRLQQAFRSRGLPVIFCIAGSYTEDGRDLPQWLSDFNQLSLMLLGQRSIPMVNDPSWQIDESISPLAGEIVLNKTSSGPLNSTKLDQTLHNMGINSLIVCGLTTAVCVTQTAREAADRGFRVIVAEDACTEMSEEMHRAALETFSLTFGRVRNTDALIELFAAAPIAQMTNA